jgi:hypothetical protein
MASSDPLAGHWFCLPWGLAVSGCGGDGKSRVWRRARLGGGFAQSPWRRPSGGLRGGGGGGPPVAGSASLWPSVLGCGEDDDFRFWWRRIRARSAWCTRCPLWPLLGHGGGWRAPAGVASAVGVRLGGRPVGCGDVLVVSRWCGRQWPPWMCASGATVALMATAKGRHTRDAMERNWLPELRISDAGENPPLLGRHRWCVNVMPFLKVTSSISFLGLLRSGVDSGVQASRRVASAWSPFVRALSLRLFPFSFSLSGLCSVKSRQ